MRPWFVATVLLAFAGSTSPAQEMTPPRVTSVEVDWSPALRTLSEIAELKPPAGAKPEPDGPVPSALGTLNAIMERRFPGLAASPAPVLLPFDTAALMRDLAAGTAAESNDRYLSGFHARAFFFAGPSGYDAAFGIRVNDVPELADIRFADPIDVHMSGSTLHYELDPPPPANGTPVADLEDDFPGIRRILHEHHVRYTFVRHGVPYVVSVNCFDAGISRYRLPTCRTADTIIARFLRALRVTGGTPLPPRTIEARAIERPQELSPNFTYHPPGKLLSSTGARGQSGRQDRTVYAPIRFPLADTPAYANSQLFQSRNRPPADQPQASPNYSYPWRDNFCERRGFPVGQCPAGIGHQGQDLRPAPCSPQPCQRHHNLVAVRDGAILRMPKQEAVYLVVNTATEHLRFRYLHMSPRKMDEDNVLSGRLVREGEVIGQVSNYSRKEGGTSYHLHFDVQVPTRTGWVFVNPYMTLVSAYERLLGSRGAEIGEPALAAAADAETPGAESSKPRRIGARFAFKHKAGRHHKYSRHKLSRHHKYSKYSKRKRHRLARY